MTTLLAFSEAELKALLIEAAEQGASLALAKVNGTGDQPASTEKPIAGKELCAYLGITAPTLIRYRKKGKIPSLKIGCKILYNKDDVVKALANTGKR